LVEHHGQIDKIVLDKEIEMETQLHASNMDIAKDMDCQDFSEYIAFCMKEVAKYRLEVDHRRFSAWLGTLLTLSVIS
jgi:hypothetical protein